MIRAADALDVQMALARMTRLRVSTHDLRCEEVQYVIGLAWKLTLDEHELDGLAQNIDSPAMFKEAYDKLKYTCLTRADFVRAR